MVKFGARTDPGRKRVNNEDSYAIQPDNGLFVVADGVGGRTAGEVASAMCAEIFEDEGAALRERALAYTDAPSVSSRNGVLAAIDDVCQLASRRVYERAEAEGKAGMTTTLVAVLIAGNTAFLAHVGDSRAYLLRDGELRQLTEDHSMINELVRTGKMTYAEARASKHRNVITRAIGLYPTVQPSLATVDLFPGDRILLCSDGLSDVVGPDDVQAIAGMADLDLAVNDLTDAALRAGGPDNITVVLVDPAGSAQSDDAVVRARVLEHLFLFENMPYAARLQVARILEERWFAPGETLVAEGTAGTSMYVIIDGEVSVHVAGKELARLGSGEHFGELSLVDQQPRSASVVGVTFGNAISISAEHLDEFCRREPELGVALLWRLLRVLGARLRGANDMLTRSPF